MYKIAIGCDHIVTGFKNEIRDMLIEKGYDVTDCGTYDDDRTHYPIDGKKVAELVASGIVDRGIVICGTAVGISNAAQKTKNARVALVSDISTTISAREKYDANIIAFGGRIIGRGLAEDIVETFLNADYKQSAENDDNIKLINSIITNEDNNHTFDPFIIKWNEGFYHD